MHLLVTRPQADASGLIEQLEAAGHKVSHFPLLEINFHDAVKLPGVKPQAILITSANGARGIARQARIAALLDVLVIVVGVASADAARQAGFKNIQKTKRGDILGVIDYVRQNLKPQDGPLLYASGHKTSGDLIGELQSSGFAVERMVLYQAERAKELPPQICRAVRQGDLDGVVLFSPRTAKIWLSIALCPSKYSSESCLSPAELANIKHYCLSENVAKIIDRGLGKSSDTIICKEPDMSGMLQAIRQAT